MTDQAHLSAPGTSWSELAARAAKTKRVILHFHRNPGTGVWAMMKNLTREQSKSPGACR